MPQNAILLSKSEFIIWLEKIYHKVSHSGHSQFIISIEDQTIKVFEKSQENSEAAIISFDKSQSTLPQIFFDS